MVTTNSAQDYSSLQKAAEAVQVQKNGGESLTDHLGIKRLAPPRTGSSAATTSEGLRDRPVRSQVLTEAETHINGDRNASYGDPTQDFQRTAEFWNTYISGVLERKLRNFEDLDPRTLEQVTNVIDSWDVAQMMVLLKISRSTVTPQKRDHWVDEAGYIGCGAECVAAHMGELS